MPPRSRRPRVFIGLTEVAGYYRSLEVGFREIGVDARFFEFSANPFQYGSKDPRPPRASPPPLPKLHPRRVLYGIWYRTGRPIVHVARALTFLAWGIARYDAFIFYGLDSFFGYRDLPLLKRFGRKVIYVFNGSDHRPPYLNGKFVRELDQHPPAWLARETAIVKRRVETIERHADAIVALSASAQFHTRPFLHFLAMGLPHTRSSAPEARQDGRVTRILHSPSNRVSKGSDHIRSVVDRLKAAGHDIDYVELTGRPNAEVIAEIARASFVVDEMYSDTPLAGFGVEAAWQGRATVVSGLFAPFVESDIPAEFVPPSRFTVPDEIDASIEQLVANPGEREDLGHRARLYVEAHWQPAAVAERFLAVIEGRTPPEWWYEPDRLQYFGGWGMPEPLLREGIRDVLSTGGPDALCLNDKPELRERVVSFAQ